MCLLAGTPLVPVETLGASWTGCGVRPCGEEELSQEELKLASMGTSSPCAHGSLTILLSS